MGRKSVVFWIFVRLEVNPMQIDFVGVTGENWQHAEPEITTKTITETFTAANSVDEVVADTNG